MRLFGFCSDGLVFVVFGLIILIIIVDDRIFYYVYIEFKFGVVGFFIVFKGVFYEWF